MAHSGFHIERDLIAEALAQQRQDPLDVLTVLVCLLRRAHVGQLPGIIPSMVEMTITAARYTAVALRDPARTIQVSDDLGGPEQLELIADMLEGRLPMWHFLRKEQWDADASSR